MAPLASEIKANSDNGSLTVEKPKPASWSPPAGVPAAKPAKGKAAPKP